MLNTDSFIQKARNIHGTKYDYSKVQYEHCQTKVTIICPEHGEFQQAPSTHLIGCGCPQCGKIIAREKAKLTKEEFIKKAIEIHGDKYDYSKVQYEKWDEKVTIICPEHGEFYQTPSAHIHKHRKHGCPLCGKIKSKELAISQGKETLIKFLENNHLYEANIDDYVTSITPMTIVCKKHGHFQITPNNLYNQKIPCPKCREEIKTKKIKKEKAIRDYKQEFIDKLEKKYPNRFDTSNVNYVNENTIITLFDTYNNNEINVLPSKILYVSDIMNLPENKNNKFIQKAIKIHGGRYDYSKVDYINNKTKVCIICPEHGEFLQTPNEHLKGHGCAKCANNIKWNIDEYITEVKKIHGDKYDYSKVILGKQSEHITLICPVHGEFQIRAMHHLKGSGCPECKGSGGEKALLTFFKEKKMKPLYNKFYKWLNNYQLDFFFPEYNIAIEVQGRQHFEEVTFLNGNLCEIQKRDNLKKQLCEEHGITLLYFANYKMDFPYKVCTTLDELWECMIPYIKIN